MVATPFVLAIPSRASWTNALHAEPGKVIVPAEECLLCRITTPSAAGATSTQFSPLLLRLEIRHARRSAVVISVLRTRHQGLDACDDGIGGIGLRQRCCAPPIRRQSTRPDLILILDVDGTSGYSM
jgi:hypothetical protein